MLALPRRWRNLSFDVGLWLGAVGRWLLRHACIAAFGRQTVCTVHYEPQSRLAHGSALSAVHSQEQKSSGLKIQQPEWPESTQSGRSAVVM